MQRYLRSLPSFILTLLLMCAFMCVVACVATVPVGLLCLASEAVGVHPEIPLFTVLLGILFHQHVQDRSRRLARS